VHSRISSSMPVPRAGGPLKTPCRGCRRRGRGRRSALSTSRTILISPSVLIHEEGIRQEAGGCERLKIMAGREFFDKLEATHGVSR
jgi:hypothetical protein